MRHLLFLLLPLLLLTGCPADADVTPAFVIVEDFNLTTPGLPGTTENITEVWAFADNVFLGAFRLPARIPVHRSGTTNLRFEAGVRQNGISATPDIYEFYTPVERQLELVPGETTELGVLNINYRDDVRFALLEDFEDVNERVFTDVQVGDGPFELSTDVVRSGNASGVLRLSEDNPLVELGSSDLRDLIANRPYVWLEVDFQSTVPGIWGVVGQDGFTPVRLFDPGFRAQPNWTKIYFNLSEIIVLSNLDEYQLVFSTILPEDQAEGEVYLDNIRLLYF